MSTHKTDVAGEYLREVELRLSGLPLLQRRELLADLDAHIAGIERDLIDQSLERSGGNKRKAAEILGLKRTTLVEKLKRLQR